MVCGCGKVRPLNPYIIGIQYDYNNMPTLVLYNCARCGSTRAIPWGEASEAHKAEARQVELSKMAVCR